MTSATFNVVEQTITEPTAAASATRRRSSAILHDIGEPSSSTFADDASDQQRRRSSPRPPKHGRAAKKPHRKKSNYKPLPKLESSGDDAEGRDDRRRRSSAELPSQTEGENRPTTVAVVPATWRDYWTVLKSYPKYRYYLLSHLCQHMGDWFVRIASLLFVEEMGGGSGKSLAMLVLSDHLPRVVFAQVGGILSDMYDRRRLMIAMDLLSGVAVLGFLLAVARHSLPLLYATATVRASISAAYYPVTSGIVPLIVPDARDLQFAVTLNSWAWSFMAVLGGLVAGSATAVLGLRTCYVIDCVTFIVSAAVVYWGIPGSYNVSQQSSPSAAGMGCGPNSSKLDGFKQLASYLTTCGFGLLVLMKASAGLVWGPEDIIGAEFATVRDEDGNEEEKPSSFHMGLLFSIIGVGCFVGPALTNLVSDSRHPSTLQRACVVGFLFLTMGWMFISRATTFDAFLAGTLVRTMGSGIVWTNASALLQTLTEKEILGRMLALEYACYTISESLSATITGELSDAGLTKQELALFGASLGFAMICSWGTYHAFSLGAAREKFDYLGRQNHLGGEHAGGKNGELELPNRRGSLTETEGDFV